jgi:hypothetical protein
MCQNLKSFADAWQSTKSTRITDEAKMSDIDVVHAADAMMREFGEHAESEAARFADLMLGHSNRAGLLIWAKIWRAIAEVQPAPRSLPH